MRFYPCEGCPHCRSTEYRWTEVSGRGSLYSWIVVHRSVDPVWQARAPFVTGIVELEEGKGVLVPGIILGVAPEAVREGMKVQGRVRTDRCRHHGAALARRGRLSGTNDG